MRYGSLPWCWKMNLLGPDDKRGNACRWERNSLCRSRPPMSSSIPTTYNNVEFHSHDSRERPRRTATAQTRRGTLDGGWGEMGRTGTYMRRLRSKPYTPRDLLCRVPPLNVVGRYRARVVPPLAMSSSIPTPNMFILTWKYSSGRGSRKTGGASAKRRRPSRKRQRRRQRGA